MSEAKPSGSASISSTDSPLATSTYPPIKKGASLLVAWQLANRRVLLIGGGQVASGRLFFLLEAGAHVTLVAPSPLEPSIAHRVETYPEDVTWISREFILDPENPEVDTSTYNSNSSNLQSPMPRIEDFDMVLTAIDDVNLSRAICHRARSLHIPVNVADVPPECDFYFGAQFRKGPLQVMVSTSGQGPKISVIVRDALASSLPADVEDAIAGVGALRGELRARAPGVGGELSRRRMTWMIGTCDKWTLSQMGAMKNEDVRKKLLDDGWEKGKVLGPREVGVGGGVIEKVIELASGASIALWSGIGGFVGGAAVATVFTFWVWKK